MSSSEPPAKCEAHDHPVADTIEVMLERARTVRGDAVCGRYAPSPTGDLHLGNLRTALVAWLQARLTGGTFVLRMEDLDPPRNKPGSAGRVMRDLQCLGLDWDEGPDTGGPLGPYSQLERTDLYHAAFECLERGGRVFPCYCSRKDIREAASAPHGAAAIYPGTCRGRGIENHDGAAAPPAWRLALHGETIQFHDCLRGMHRQHLPTKVGDFVIRRRDQIFAYQLAVVMDDALMGITDVVRGGDLIDSTPRQIHLQSALGLPTPRYWHVPVLRDGRGRRLSKRDGADSLDDYIVAGGTPESLVATFAAGLNLIDRAEPLSASELLAQLDKSALLTAA